MRAMNLRSVLDHQLMHFTAKQRVATQLKRLSKARLVDQEVKALVHIVVLLILAVAVVLVCLTDCLRQDLADVICNLVLGCRIELIPHGSEEGFDEMVEPAEGSIVAHYLALVIPLNPCVDCDGDNQAESRRVEVEHRCGRGDVVVCEELRDVVFNRDPDETDMIGL